VLTTATAQVAVTALIVSASIGTPLGLVAADLRGT
jgi:hypothetical protein